MAAVVCLGAVVAEVTTMLVIAMTMTLIAVVVAATMMATVRKLQAEGDDAYGRQAVAVVATAADGAWDGLMNAPDSEPMVGRVAGDLRAKRSREEESLSRQGPTPQSVARQGQTGGAGEHMR